MGIFTKYFLPNEYVQSIFDIKPEHLKSKNIKAIITDLDNTLVGWDVKDPTDEVRTWFEEMKEQNITVTIVSNNNQERVASFSSTLNIDYIFKARKPRGKAFRQASNLMDVNKSEVVVIGDQMLTDVFGGNRNGLYTIMVVPVKKTDGLVTKFNRLIERRFLNYFKRKGLINWEE
ncbi:MULTISPECIES: YqeG family HAD IIIA-type phosphatase [Mammaliicoccus]|uniref:YqeG family HAD IIIA-type phosphatase n=1 Tax=Mammaliicoccus fleurettii TaxID=150056 RepID=A0ABS5MKP1_9STAP|nr:MULTISPECIES: YqeG family HAD IIIA-type phosphatase [Mammaliicoccus]HCN61423.1 YqeG family HAD IIIA-type phosphatase [Staphylococcus sp.]MBL0846268.1 YqeG family HAD IIIA-type phosphatase [Mammaliicoccus fleurettii]MBO3062370.1 YqeG family HAD IIIA-type phosphatase [Mammaliicoccus fleurettii]MBS3671131.1 YqeG family HAD IIIA-type phosphatase [Mammaliicoccus fleurettii]MBS3696495.1 YqeG family HAD IIIA-type phosphatase [Mammaliicoccus fleurettii]